LSPQPASAANIARVSNRLLLNFAASYSTGGYKRLYEYARWFNAHGGAWFVIHPRCLHLVSEFPSNRFFVARQSRIERLYNDCAYLREIEREIGQPDLYYSYGIPLYRPFGKVSWFHLSNVLPLDPMAAPLTVFERLKAAYLGWKIKAGLKYAQVISAESAASLQMLGPVGKERLFLSVNGSDDELAALSSGQAVAKEAIATVVGTAPYKALQDTLLLFEMLKAAQPALKLMVFGNPDSIPEALLGRPDVVIAGAVARADVVECLRRTGIYISTTRMENSYNAASEGIFFADESYISDIGPHRELLIGEPFDTISVPGLGRPLLKVRREKLSGLNLKSWDVVVSEMIARYRSSAEGR
jgi:hypothetical protein